MNGPKFIKGISIAATILTILAPVNVSSSEVAEEVYEWNRLEYEIAGESGILADKHRVR